jgi:hypothetical protein
VAGIAASSLLNSVSFSLATADDDADIRRLLRENPMPGRVSISMEREPDARLAAAVEGDVHHTIIARDDDGTLIAMGSVAVRDAYLNGRVARVGYLGQLRLDHRVRPCGAIIRAGYQFFRELRPTLGADLLFTSIASDNTPARRLLERALPGMPIYRPIDQFVTSLFPVQATPRRGPKDIHVDCISADHVGEMIDCLARNAARFNLVPRWRASDLSPRIGSGELEAILATRNGRAVGCMAAWNQSAYKQTIVRGYSPAIARWRHLINLGGPLLRQPYLPPVNTPLKLMYLSHVAIDDDNPDVFAALLRYACSPIDLWFGEEHRSYFVLGLSVRHPLLRAIPRRFRRRTYRTNLYTVSWKDDDHPVITPDKRPCQPEVALL